LELSVDSL